MSTPFTPDALAELIAIGENESFDLIVDVISRHPELKSGKFMRQGSDSWKVFGDRLLTKELVNLCKVLTIGESTHSNWKAGSVSPVIWLYHVLDTRHDWDRVVVTNWLLSHTTNPYVPFTNHGAVSLEDYKQIVQSKAEIKVVKRHEEESRALSGRENKAKAASINLANALRRGDRAAVNAMLAKGADADYKPETGLTAREMAIDLGRLDWLELPQEN